MTLLNITFGKSTKKCLYHSNSDIKPHECYNEFSVNDEEHKVGDFVFIRNQKQKQVSKIICMYMLENGTFHIVLETYNKSTNKKSIIVTGLTNSLEKCDVPSSQLNSVFGELKTTNVLSKLNFNSPYTELKSPLKQNQTPDFNSIDFKDDGAKVTLDDGRCIGTPRRNSVRRDLNKSFGDVHDYSIIEPAEENSLKVKLRKSKRHKLTKNEQSPSLRKSTRNISRKSYAEYISPNKLGKELVDEICSHNEKAKVVRRLYTPSRASEDTEMSTSSKLNYATRRRTNHIKKQSTFDTPSSKMRTTAYCESETEDADLCSQIENPLNESLRTATLRINLDRLNIKDSPQIDDCAINSKIKEGNVEIEKSPVSTSRTKSRASSSSKFNQESYTKTPRSKRNAKLMVMLSPEKIINIPIRTPSRTPKNRMKLIRDGIITPSMQYRSTTVEGDSTPLMKARSQLHVSFVPKSLPCREKEYADIYGFLYGKLQDGCGGCMYVSGVPGTGKTATVTSVINSLQQDKSISNFTFVNINGMRLTEPRQSYVEIVKQLTGKAVPWEQAQSMLEDIFVKSKKSMPVVMLIDELDILCTKRQDVVYNLLDWPTKAKNQLIVITIANTMDLPERLLMSRVTSRLGLTRLTFQAYTYKQLQEIVSMRLCGTDTFNPDAVQFVARKVASVSGDARRALDICRRAAEIAEAEGKFVLVNMTHVNDALNLMITQPKVQAIRRCSFLEQLILQSIVGEVERTGVEETNFGDVYKMLVSYAAIEGFQMVSTTIALTAVAKLGACRLILSDPKCNNIHQRIVLNVSADDIFYALKNSS